MRTLLLAGVLACTAVAAAEPAAKAKPPGHGGGGIDRQLPRDEITAAQRAAIKAEIAANVQRLRDEGRLAPARGGAITFGWPVVAAASVTDPGVHGISNFVDQNPLFPDALLDYNCGMRTYDLTSGYNHRGVDIFSWPYPWRRMDEDAVEIVAAAAGTIVLKSDGNPDRSCGFGSANWNAVYVQHSDGSIAWYGHMKSGSLTTKSIGQAVAAGEYLGIVGSSGSSTGPHLHMEVYDAADQLIEPYAGPCNSLNPTSWWTTQPDYYDSAINGLESASAAPVFPACPLAEPDSSRRVFAAGELVYLVAFYRDQLDAQTSDYTLFRPDGSVHWNWQHSSSAPHYAASYWYWFFNLSGAPLGTWRWRVSFEGQTVERLFERVAIADADADGVDDHLDNCMATANPDQCDTDGDGFGNHCDADLNDDLVVDDDDVQQMRLSFGASGSNDADLNCDDVVNSFDLRLMRQNVGGTPGPSAYSP